MFKKIALIAVLVAAVFGFFYFDLNTYLTLDGLKGSLDTFTQQIEENPLVSIGVFFAIYVAVTALSLPGAAILTLAAGALFGLVQGFIIVSFASSVGATLAFLVARFILRDTVRKRFGEKKKKEFPREKKRQEENINSDRRKTFVSKKKNRNSRFSRKKKKFQKNNVAFKKKTEFSRTQWSSARPHMQITLFYKHPPTVPTNLPNRSPDQ